MPTYQYVCTDCDAPMEAVQAFTDDALTECPTCGGRLRKVFSAVGVVFKGSGFYRTDSRKDAESGAASAKDKGGSDKGGSEKATNDKGSDKASDQGAPAPSKESSAKPEAAKASAPAKKSGSDTGGSGGTSGSSSAA